MKRDQFSNCHAWKLKLEKTILPACGKLEVVADLQPSWCCLRSDAVSDLSGAADLQLLGGAAIHRCDHRLVRIAAL